MKTSSFGLFVAALFCAGSIHAQSQGPSAISPELQQKLDEIAAKHERMRSAFAPAPVDRTQFNRLVEQLASDGTRMPLDQISSGLQLQGAVLVPAGADPILVGMSVVEFSPHAVETESEDDFKDLVFRRYFGRLSAQMQIFKIDAETHVGIVQKWNFTVSAHGMLLDATCEVIPVFERAKGVYEGLPGATGPVGYGPSSPTAQEQWKVLVPDLLRLHRTISI